MVAFGGGVLVAAVAFVLTPDAIETLSIAPLVLLFLAGAFLFFFVDRFIERRGEFLSQLIAMLMDFIPEAIALGATFGLDRRAGLLLAVFIGLQNLPESFNSYLDLRRSGISANRCLLILFPLSFKESLLRSSVTAY
jgi:ZIP family zinc transporter